jgi:2-oxoglutarate ferredoxin oxidoreductase subunit beta
MNLTVFLHDNQIYGLTKKQASPTSPIGTKSNTTPRGSYLDALNPLSVALGVANASFIAQAVDWIPESLFQIVKAAYHHKGFSFVRILQRCPEWLPKSLDPWMHDPDRIQMLHHENSLQLSSGVSSVYKNQLVHDPLDMNRAREIAGSEDLIPVGILYQNRDIPRYEETRQTGVLRTTDTIRKGFEAELDKYSV